MAALSSWPAHSQAGRTISSGTAWQAAGSSVLELVVIAAGGIALLLAFHQWRTAWCNRPGNQSLAREARSLKRLRIGYPEGMVYLESMKKHAFLKKTSPWVWRQHQLDSLSLRLKPAGRPQ